MIIQLNISNRANNGLYIGSWSCLLLLFSFFFMKCADAPVRKEDRQLVRVKYAEKKEQLLKGEPSILKEWSGQLNKLEFLYQCILEPPMDSGKAGTELGRKKSALKQGQIDSADYYFYEDVLTFQKEHAWVQQAKIVIQDSSNKYILACTIESDWGQLLIILNMDEDNQAFVGNYPYNKLPVLLCNYAFLLNPPIFTSLALRPFEARVYRIR